MTPPRWRPRSSNAPGPARLDATNPRIVRIGPGVFLRDGRAFSSNGPFGYRLRPPPLQGGEEGSTPSRVIVRASDRFGMWESLAIRLPWEQETAGSNPAIPTSRLVFDNSDASIQSVPMM